MLVESQRCDSCQQDKSLTDFFPCHEKFSDTGYLKTCKECKLTPKEPYFIALSDIKETGLL